MENMQWWTFWFYMKNLLKCTSILAESALANKIKDVKHLLLKSFLVYCLSSFIIYLP